MFSSVGCSKPIAEKRLPGLPTTLFNLATLAGTLVIHPPLQYILWCNLSSRGEVWASLAYGPFNIASRNDVPCPYFMSLSSVP